jgi:hypothetical protein
VYLLVRVIFGKSRDLQNEIIGEARWPTKKAGFFTIGDNNGRKSPRHSGGRGYEIRSFVKQWPELLGRITRVVGFVFLFFFCLAFKLFWRSSGNH